MVHHVKDIADMDAGPRAKVHAETRAWAVPDAILAAVVHVKMHAQSLEDRHKNPLAVRLVMMNLIIFMIKLYQLSQHVPAHVLVKRALEVAL